MGKSIAVLGIGRFGKKLALSLSDMGAEVMVVDASTEVLEKMSPFVTYAIEADLKDVEALKGIGLEGMDAVVVAMGSDLRKSVFLTYLQKRQMQEWEACLKKSERTRLYIRKRKPDFVQQESLCQIPSLNSLR